MAKLLFCPSCRQVYFDTIYNWCADCKCELEVIDVSLIRSAELRDEVEGAGAGETPNSLRTED